MDQKTTEYQYVKGQMREHFGTLLSSFEKRSIEALNSDGWEIDIPYGSHSRELFDVKPAGTNANGTIIYFHAGYWQARDKSQFRFLASAFNVLGWHFALVNYPLCPEVSIADIVNSAMRSVQSIDKYQRDHHRDGHLVLCGHSAGAHLAVELALRKDQLPTPSVAGVIAISGIFELQPLITTTLNERLKLDLIKAQAYSPFFRVSKALAPALFIVGESETLAFHMQSQEMALQWKMHGNSSDFQLVQDADHFLILEKIMGKAGAFNNFCNEFLLRG